MSARVAARRWRLAVRLNVVALVWSAGLVLAGLLVPAYTSNSTSHVNGVTLTRSTLAQENGVRAMALMAVPLLVSCVVLWAIRARRSGARWGGPLAWMAITLLTAEALVGFMTIGLFVVPAIVLLAVATRRAPGAGAAATGSGSTSSPGRSPSIAELG
jgi:heme/copper-type cytochrome/quinol oxidase subunit 3